MSSEGVSGGLGAVRRVGSSKPLVRPGVTDKPAGGAANTRPKVVFKDRFTQSIITIHRWIGLIACLYFVVWFVSGLVLAYVRWPAMDADDKLKVLKPMEWSSVRLDPTSALSKAGLSEFPKDLRLEMSGGRPVYRITDWTGRYHTIMADDGAEVRGVSPEHALATVREQLSAPGATLVKADLNLDQWTTTGYWNKERPFHLVRLNDKAGSEYYVSIATGEVVLDTTRHERVWNWVGAIPHWLYFEIIRSNTGLWQWTVYILAGAGIFVAISGMWIGLTRLRLRARYANGAATPFRGWMKWHHVSGLLGGLFLTLWIITGFWTMYPGGVLEKRSIETAEYTRFAGTTRPELSMGSLAALGEAAGDAKRATFVNVAGRALISLDNGVAPPRLLDAASLNPIALSTAAIGEAAKRIMPNYNVVAVTRLEKGDEYWHSGFYPKKVPIVRVAFDDPANTWFHIDPDAGRILGLVDDTARFDRWTIVALHDLDFKALLERRPMWDLVLFAVTLPGLLISITAVVVGWRRLQRTGLVPAGGAQALSFRTGGGRWTPARPASAVTPAALTDTCLVLYASQTGTAEKLAAQTAEGLRASGRKVVVKDLAQIDAGALQEVREAFFVIATSGDGDPPDHIMGFERRVMGIPAAFPDLKYAVLALGDRQYHHFCGFAGQVEAWLRRGGARPLFATVEVDDLDPDALAAWSRDLGRVTGASTTMAVEQAAFEPWRLVERRLVNPGSAGGAAFHLEFEPVTGTATWEAGDIAQIAAGLTWGRFEAEAGEWPEREFSIASTPAAGRIHLLVRLLVKDDGELGLASGFLSILPIGEQIPLRIRRNGSFHGPADDRPMILIGNGTGIAGLRSHLMRRVELGHQRNWLFFGERNAQTDGFYREQLEAWREAGAIERLDLVYSRDQPQRRYVQHAVRSAGEDLKAWVDAGAVVYVCGSLEGMAPAVTEAILEVVGEEAFYRLASNGAYRRDVY